MGVVIDKALGEALIHSHPIDSGSTTPVSASTGKMFLNTATGVLAIYFQSAWHTLHTLITVISYKLLEDGDSMLLENGDRKLLEG